MTFEDGGIFAIFEDKSNNYRNQGIFVFIILVKNLSPYMDCGWSDISQSFKSHQYPMRMHTQSHKKIISGDFL